MLDQANHRRATATTLAMTQHAVHAEGVRDRPDKPSRAQIALDDRARRRMALAPQVERIGNASLPFTRLGVSTALYLGRIGTAITAIGIAIDQTPAPQLGEHVAWMATPEAF